MELTPRERVILAVNHQETERIPIDFGAMRSTGINAVVYNQLKEYLQMTGGQTRVYDVKQLLADPELEVLQLFGADVLQLHRLAPSIGLKIDQYKPGKLPDGSACLVPENFHPQLTEEGDEVLTNDRGQVICKRPKGGLYFDEIYAPLEKATGAEVEAFTYPAITEAELQYLEKQAGMLYHTHEYAILGAAGVSIFEKGLKDFGYEEFLVRISQEKETIECYLSHLTSAYLQMLDRYLNAVGEYIQIIQFSDDLGMQYSPLIPPKVYRELFKPFHAELVQFVKAKHKNLKVALHSCGSIFDLIPDLIEAGFDILNPIQTNAAKMDPLTLKKEFGRALTFWGGGCSTQTTLTFGSTADVIKETTEMINIFAPGGGFVFNQVHNIQPGVAPEKIVALYATANEMGLKHHWGGN